MFEIHLSQLAQFVHNYANNEDSKDFMIHINLNEEDTKNSLFGLSKLKLKIVMDINGSK